MELAGDLAPEGRRVGDGLSARGGGGKRTGGPGAGSAPGRRRGGRRCPLTCWYSASYSAMLDRFACFTKSCGGSFHSGGAAVAAWGEPMGFGGGVVSAPRVCHCVCGPVVLAPDAARAVSRVEAGTPPCSPRRGPTPAYGEGCMSRHRRRRFTGQRGGGGGGAGPRQGSVPGCGPWFVAQAPGGAGGGVRSPCPHPRWGHTNTGVRCEGCTGIVDHVG